MSTKEERQEQVMHIVQTVSLMRYQPGQDYDYFYPTMDQLYSLGTVKEDGTLELTETDIAFLAWVMHPIDPESISAEQRQSMTIAAQLIQDYIEQPEQVVIDDEERQAMAELLAKYNKKHAQ